MNPPSLPLVQHPVRSRPFLEEIAGPTKPGDFPALTPLNRGNGIAPAAPDVNGIVLRIRSLLPTLTPLEAGVVTALLKKRTIDKRTLLKWVADEMGVAESTVVKIAKKLGFSGFRALRSALAEYNNFPTSQLHAELFANDSAGKIVQKVVQAAMKALEQNLTVIEQTAIEKAAKYLSSSVFRDFYGVGGSAQVARDAAFKFLRIGVRVSVFDDSQMMLMSACLLEKTDVAVAFSHSGQTSVVIDAVRQARKNGTRIIGVTNCRTSILAQESDVVLCPNVEESLITGENAAARIAQLNIVDALFLAVAQKSSGIAERNLRRTTSAVRGQRNVW
jgi:RpiR family transcriptional regulator, repressor of rpiB and als operon